MGLRLRKADEARGFKEEDAVYLAYLRQQLLRQGLSYIDQVEPIVDAIAQMSKRPGGYNEYSKSSLEAKAAQVGADPSVVCDVAYQTIEYVRAGETPPYDVPTREQARSAVKNVRQLWSTREGYEAYLRDKNLQRELMGAAEVLVGEMGVTAYEDMPQVEDDLHSDDSLSDENQLGDGDAGDKA
jgi:hypothetical protein